MRQLNDGGNDGDTTVPTDSAADGDDENEEVVVGVESMDRTEAGNEAVVRKVLADAVELSGLASADTTAEADEASGTIIWKVSLTDAASTRQCTTSLLTPALIATLLLSSSLMAGVIEATLPAMATTNSTIVDAVATGSTNREGDDSNAAIGMNVGMSGSVTFGSDTDSGGLAPVGKTRDDGGVSDAADSGLASSGQPAVSLAICSMRCSSDDTFAFVCRSSSRIRASMACSGACGGGGGGGSAGESACVP